VHEQPTRPEHLNPMDISNLPASAAADRAAECRPCGSGLEPLYADSAIESEPEDARTALNVRPARYRSPEALENELIPIGAAERAWDADRKNRLNHMFDDRQGLRVCFIGAGLIVAFCLGWAGGSNSDRLLIFGAGANSGVQAVGAEKPIVSAKSVRPASNSTNSAPDAPKPRRNASTSGTSEQARMPSADPPRLTGPASSAKPIASVLQESPMDVAALTVRTPVPETRPATIAGWTVRDVQGGRATLEGPGGVWKAATGDTLPGVGQIHSIVLWGGRWVVATSKGLIATP
jgi:hypothetical protein